MPITQLIDKLDSSELVRDRLALILLQETASQQALAAAATPTPKNPDPWKLRVFLENTHPWSEWLERPETDENPEFSPPIVNISTEGVAFDKSASNVVEKQKGTGTYHIDVYGYGVACETEDGQLPGDQAAALECQRAMRLVRNIIMAGTYTYLDFPRGKDQVVASRWPVGITYFQPQIDGRTVQNVIGGRLTLEVTFSELSPQVEGFPLEWVNLLVKRETGEVVLDVPVTQTLVDVSYDIGAPGDGTTP